MQQPTAWHRANPGGIDPGGISHQGQPLRGIWSDELGNQLLDQHLAGGTGTGPDAACVAEAVLLAGDHRQVGICLGLAERELELTLVCRFLLTIGSLLGLASADPARQGRIRRRRRHRGPQASIRWGERQLAIEDRRQGVDLLACGLRQVVEEHQVVEGERQ